MLSSISVGARSSPLSIAQAREVEKEIGIPFDLLLYETTGDRDQNTSLWSLGKTNFFTKEIDEALLAGTCRIAIHSAKDLPDPLPEGLILIALTSGVDPRDALVLRKGETLASLPDGARIGTSSPRRAEALHSLRADLSPVDMRGTIQQRLALLEKGKVDGVIVAEAALVRLGLSPNRLYLPGSTTPLQGKLAVLSRAGDEEMRVLFQAIDSR